MRFTLGFLLLCIIKAASAQLYVSEPDPKILTPFIEKLSEHIRTNGPINIVVEPCGMVNAFWDNASQITVCQEYIASLLKKQSTSIQKTAGRVDPKSIYQTYFGEAVFVVLHELGHAMLDRHKIPFSGREEDTADQFAAFILMAANNPNLFLGAANFFAEPSQLFKVFGRRQLTDEHSLNIQRRAQLICWGYGRDPRLMQQFAAHAGMDSRRLQHCGEEYRLLMQNTPRLFAAVFNNTNFPTSEPLPPSLESPPNFQPRSGRKAKLGEYCARTDDCEKPLECASTNQCYDRRNQWIPRIDTNKSQKVYGATPPQEFNW